MLKCEFLVHSHLILWIFNISIICVSHSDRNALPFNARLPGRTGKQWMVASYKGHHGCSYISCQGKTFYMWYYAADSSVFSLVLLLLID